MNESRCSAIEEKSATEAPLRDEERAHARTCDRCRETLAFTSELSRAARPRAEAANPTPAEVGALREAVRARLREGRPSRRVAWALVPVVVACGVIVWFLASREPAPAPEAPAVAVAAPSAAPAAIQPAAVTPEEKPRSLDLAVAWLPETEPISLPSLLPEPYLRLLDVLEGRPL